MLEMKISIEAPELLAVLNRIEAAILAKAGSDSVTQTTEDENIQLTTPASNGAAFSSSPPNVGVFVAAAQTVPTEPVYTLEQIAKAGAALAQAGKMEQALALLAKYGVQTVNQLQPEQYGAFAADLRALGAQV